ncbi:MAG: response regulator [Pseudolabrys sp.]
MNLLILVVDDEPDVEVLFRQQFRHDLRVGRFAMKFTPSGDVALQHIADAAGVSIILILSDINMPGMTGLELLPKAKAARPDVPGRGGAFCQATILERFATKFDTRVERAA